MKREVYSWEPAGHSGLKNLLFQKKLQGLCWGTARCSWGNKWARVQAVQNEGEWMWEQEWWLQKKNSVRTQIPVRHARIPLKWRKTKPFKQMNEKGYFGNVSLAAVRGEFWRNRQVWKKHQLPDYGSHSNYWKPKLRRLVNGLSMNTHGIWGWDAWKHMQWCLISYSSWQYDKTLERNILKKGLVWLRVWGDTLCECILGMCCGDAWCSCTVGMYGVDAW